MSRKYSRSLLRISVAQICQNLGWHSAQSSSLEVLTDVLERYLLQLGGTCHRYAEQFGRTQANLDDLGLAFRHMGINISELEDYVRHVEPVPFAHEVVAFPAAKPATNLGFPNSRSREVLQHRDEHIPAHLPYMLPNMKDEIPEEKVVPIANTIDNPDKQEFVADSINKDDPLAGDKRPASSISSADMPPSKRPRFGNSYLPEEVGHSQYEMTCVFMGPNGVLTTRQGVQGRLPEACMPPPNPRTLIEGANKENKSKDSAVSTKITIGVGGIGANGLPSIKHDKKNKKSLHKKSFAHDHSGKSAIETHKDSKKSLSSKAAAKFLKKLKASKKSSKLFSKSKIKDSKGADKHRVDAKSGFKKGGSEPADPDFQEKPKRKKEKKSVAIVDSEEELRNLSTPTSSCRSSPERLVIKDRDGSAVKKAQLEAINDSINSVLREAPVTEKITKKKKKEIKADEHAAQVGESPEGKIKRKPGRPPKKIEPVPPPPPIDIKPFVSDKYSPKELEVYEFSDSPPHAAVSARRPSAAETVSPMPNQHAPHPPPQSHTPAPQPTPKHESAPQPRPKVHKRIEPEDQLFAPEIKFDSMKSVPKDKQKSKVKVEKKNLTSKDTDKLKPKDEKIDKNKEKKSKFKNLKEHTKEDRNDSKEKERKEKKDKRKEKDKKKKHKERGKERDREREKLKKIENKIKQEVPASRESSPANVLGVKLKIKIGGSTGPSSMMVTGDSSSATPSPASLVGSKRDSVSPHKIVPKLYISKSGQGGEEKPKKSNKVKSDVSKHKSSPMTSVKSSPSSNAQTSPSPRSTPTPPIPRKTPTPPPPKSTQSSKDSSHDHKKDTKLAKERKSRGPVKGTRKEKKKEKEEMSSLSEDSLSSPTSPVKSTAKHRSQTPPKLKRMASSSPEKSPPSLPFQSSTPSPRPSSRATRSPSRTSSHHNSSVSPPPLSRRKPTPPPSLSPVATVRRGRQSSPSPTKPPTPGSTSPTQSPDWNLPISPAHHRSPTPTPRTPTASPKRDSRSPSHSSLPGSPASPRKSTSPAGQSASRPGSRALNSPEPYSSKDIPSPASSGKSSSSISKPTRTVEAETVCVYFDDRGQKIWICPGCKLPDDGTEMIGCDMCDNWYHWPCVGITQAPPESQDWFCVKCLPKTKTSRGRGRPRGRGRGRGRKKIA